MTVLNVLITDRRAWIAQDHAAYDTRGMPAQHVTAAESTFKPRALPSARKLRCYPDNGLIVGIAGTALYGVLWQEYLATVSDDFDAIAAYAPEYLRELFQRYDTPMRECYVVHAGYSRAQGMVTGTLYQADHDFEPIPLPDGMVMHSPNIAADAPDAGQLNRLGARAQKGKDVRKLFNALFANQQWQERHGRLRAGVRLSEAYDMATVDRNGVRLIDAL